MPTNIAHLDVGDVWTRPATFTVGGTATDPTTLTVKSMKPDGTITTYSVPNPLSPPAGITRVSAGVFKLSEAMTSAGYWYANFTGTGAATAAEDHEAIVDPSPFTANAGLSTRALVGLGETKAWLAARQVDTEDDLVIVQLINAASTAIHNLSGREFKPYGTQPQTRSFDMDGIWGSRRTIDIDDLASFTSATYDVNTGTPNPVAIASTEIEPLPLSREEWEPIDQLRLRSGVPVGCGYLLGVTGTWVSRPCPRTSATPAWTPSPTGATETWSTTPRISRLEAKAAPRRRSCR